MRVVTILPLIFVALAVAEMWWTWRSRAYWSPVPGLTIGMATAALAIVAIWMCGAARPAAPIALALSGLCTLGMALALPRLFPLVNATTDALTLFERVRYPLGLAAIGIATVAGVHYLRRRVGEQGG